MNALRRISRHQALFILILLLGILARVWEFGALPPGLIADEAAIGVEAFDLLHYGVDRNAIPWPVHLAAWGSGQNALYAYLLIPFVAVGGLNPFIVRLPMLLTGILTLPLVYFVGRRTIDARFGLLGMFLMAISPWHILLSRSGLESNLLPFVFLCGYACLLNVRPGSHWFSLASFFFGLCLYAYGTAYAAIPVFLLLAVIVLLRWKMLRWGALAAGMAIFTVTAAPIGLFVLINTFDLDPIQLGRISIPRLPTRPRFATVSSVYGGSFWQSTVTNLATLWKVLWRQDDGLIWNQVKPFGYLYPFTLPLAPLGRRGWPPGARLPNGQSSSCCWPGWRPGCCWASCRRPISTASTWRSSR